MADVAFFDITGKRGDLYVFEGKSLVLKESMAFTVGEDFEVQLPGLPGGVSGACVSLPIECLNFRVLDMGLTEIEKIRQVLPYELEGLVLDSPQSVVIDAVMVGQKVLAVYVEKALLRKVLAGLEKVGVDPRCVTSLDLGALLGESPGIEELISRIGSPGIEGTRRAQSAAREVESCTVNFRRGEFSHRGEQEMVRRALKLTASLAIALVLLFSMDMAVRTLSVNREAARLEGSIVGDYAQIFPGRKPRGAGGLAYEVRAELNELKKKDEAYRGVSALEFLMKLQKFSSASFSINGISLSGDGVSLDGEAATLGDVQALKGKLGEVLENVVISESGEAASGKVAFVITAGGMRQ